MAIPPTATALPQPMDPSDIVDYSLTITQAGVAGAPAFPMLEAGETVASYVLALTAEAIAVGLTIRSDQTYPAPTLAGLDVKFWLSVDASLQGSAVFDAPGLTLALEMTVITSANPPRKRQKTATVKVSNQ